MAGRDDRWLVRNGLSLLQSQSDLIDAYILDFYVENHWDQRMPKCWGAVMDWLTFDDLARFVSVDSSLPQIDICFPLSLLAFRKCCQTFSLSQRPIEDLQPVEHFLRMEERPNRSSWSNESTLDKHVKLKKRHEISRVADLFDLIVKSRGPMDVVDFGAGQGHLSRLLAIRHPTIEVFRVEQNEEFLQRSLKFDAEIKGPKPLQAAVHINKKVEMADDIQQLIDSCRPKCFAGLHLCGDFSISMLRSFVCDPSAKALISLGCCYMKVNGGDDRLHYNCWDSVVTNDSTEMNGYPLSSFVGSLHNHKISYTAREAACHNLTEFRQALKDPSALSNHKSHCYRALLELLIVKNHPTCRHLGIRGIKLTETVTFRDYLNAAKYRLPPEVQLSLTDEYLAEMGDEIDQRLNQWDRVLKFYSLRLMLAPVVESIMLLDRLIFLRESGLQAWLFPIFDPRLSPRNLVLMSIK